MPADLVLTNGRVYTGEEDTPPAEGLAVRDGRVVAVGRDEDVLALAGPGTRLRSLGGRTVLPGLIDSHVHLLSYALRLGQVDLAGAASIEEALARVRAGAAELAPGEWLLGGGWDANVWSRPPTREDLDAAAPDNPVLLDSKDYHSVWASSAALALAGVIAGTPEPTAGEIVRTLTGEPTGVLRENACRLIQEVVPPPSEQRCDVALGRALAVAASKGLTGLQTFEGPEAFGSLQRLRARGETTLRVCCHLARGSLSDAVRLGLRTGFGDEWLRLGHLKLFLDGALGSRTAHMLEPFSGTDGRGVPALSPEESGELVVTAARAGVATAVHAIGDAANRVALDVLEETAPVWRPAGLRQRIEHVQLLHPDDADRLGRLGVVASMQPSHATSDWAMAERHWSGRTSLAYAWRTVLDSGAVLAFGSDCPVEQIDPLPGLYAAVARQTASGEPSGGWHPEQRLTAAEALRAFTVGSAYASGEEHLKGTLAPGKLADLVVLSEDPLAGPPEAFLRAQVEATLVGGRCVHGEL